MRTFILLMLLMLPANAGNILNKPGYYVNNPEVLFDADIERSVIHRAVTQLNNKLVDIKLKPQRSKIDYDHARDVFPTRFQPNRILVHLGRGVANVSGGYARLKAYKNKPGACYVYLKKKDYQTWSLKDKANILEHELRHCLLWDHSNITNNLRTFDNYEPLLRLYDKKNTKNACTVNIENNNGDLFYFKRRRHNKKFQVKTTGNQVKLYPGRYKVNGKKFHCHANKTVEI